MIRKMSQKSTDKNKMSVSDEGRTELLYPVLLDCTLEREVEEQGVDEPDEDEEKGERFYSAVLKQITTGDGLNVGLCEFSAGETERKVTVFKFSASYYVAFRANGSTPSDESFRTLITQAATASAWPLFRALYSQI